MSELIAALNQLEKEKGIDKDVTVSYTHLTLPRS